MKLRDLVAGVATVQPSTPTQAVVPQGAPDPALVTISSITDDSRTATPGCLFVVRPGPSGDGRAYVAQAVERGAVAVLYDDTGDAGDPCPRDSAVVRVVLNPSRVPASPATPAAPANTPTNARTPATPHAFGTTPIARAACRLAERLEGEPSEWLSLVGITGTNGKTTVATLVQQIVRGGGRPCGLIGTVTLDDGHTQVPNTLTTPGGMTVSAALGRMVRNGCSACAMEVSSHALDQGRVSALRYRVGVFTNLTGDHLDYHKTMDDYAAAKASLFAALPADGHAVVNADDPWHTRMLRDCRAKVWRCKVRDDNDANPLEAPTAVMALPAARGGVATRTPRPGVTRSGYPGPAPDLCTATVHRATLGWQEVTFAGPFGTMRVTLPLVGRHNVMNALQAAVAAHCIGVPQAVIGQVLAQCAAPPGRLEPVTTPADPFAVLVDYAHTDDALLNVLTALRPLVGAQGRLTVVFGCGGDRDRTKRPRMMRVACSLADRVIVTSDNPRTEDPEAIIDEVMAGRPEDGRCKAAQRQADRSRAIALAVGEARAGDIVLIAGKGHEDYQIIGQVKRPFDDRVEARAALGRGGRQPVDAQAGSCVGAAR